MNFINLKIHLPMSGQKTLDQFFNIKIMNQNNSNVIFI